MHRSNHFSLYFISGVPYLLPFGQGIADLKRGIQINDTGAYLWGLLEKERTEEEMLSLSAAYYEVSDSRLPELKADLHQFLTILDTFGMLDQSDCHAGPDTMPDPDNMLDSVTMSGSDSMPDPGYMSDPGSMSDPNSMSGSGSMSDPGFMPDPGYMSDSGYMFGSDAVPVCDTSGHPSAGDEIFESYTADTAQRYLSAGGLTLLLCGPEKAFSRDFDAFEIFPGSAIPVDQTVTVTLQIPAECTTGSILLKNRELTVMENSLQYIFLFPNAPGIRQVCLTKDGAEVCCHCRPPFTEDFRQDLFHAIRLPFLYLAQQHDMIVLHSASLLYRDRAWLFSGHSGAGKSTHTSLWKEHCHVPLINGDLNLLSMENGRPMVHGLPWCGTSGIVDTRSYPLGGILLIKKAAQNHIVSLDDSHAQLLVSQRLISPAWTESLLQKNLSLVAGIAPHILICRLHCTKAPEAVETAKQAIDAYLAD